jgi:hypothetical protein
MKDISIYKKKISAISVKIKYVKLILSLFTKSKGFTKRNNISLEKNKNKKKFKVKK